MKYLLALFLVVTLIGCKTSDVPTKDWTQKDLPSDLSQNSKDVEDASKDISTVADDQGKINTSIGEQTNVIRKDSGVKYDKNTSTIYSGLEQSAKLIVQLKIISAELNDSKLKLNQSELQAKEMNSAIQTLNTRLEKATEERDELKNELSVSTKKLLNKILSALIALGIVAVGVSAFVAFSAFQAGQSPFKAAAIAVGGITVTSMSIGYMYYSEAIGKVIFAIIIVVILSLAYKIYLEIRERMKVKADLSLKDKVIEYNTRLTEQIKTEVMTDEEKIAWFGAQHSDGRAGLIQKDERIKAIVHDVRKKINEIDKPVMVKAE